MSKISHFVSDKHHHHQKRRPTPTGDIDEKKTPISSPILCATFTHTCERVSQLNDNHYSLLVSFFVCARVVRVVSWCFILPTMQRDARSLENASRSGSWFMRLTYFVFMAKQKGQHNFRVTHTRACASAVRVWRV